MRPHRSHISTSSARQARRLPGIAMGARSARLALILALALIGLLAFSSANAKADYWVTLNGSNTTTSLYWTDNYGNTTVGYVGGDTAWSAPGGTSIEAVNASGLSSWGRYGVAAGVVGNYQQEDDPFAYGLPGWGTSGPQYFYGSYEDCSSNAVLTGETGTWCSSGPVNTPTFSGFQLGSVGIGIACRANLCSNGTNTGSGAVSFSSMSVEIHDPWTYPSSSVSNPVFANGSGWQNTTGDGVQTESVTGYQPYAGTCQANIGMTGPNGYSNGGGADYGYNSTPGSGGTPCPGGNVTGAISVNFSALANGTYYLNANTMSADNYQWAMGQQTINVDNNTPTVGFSSSASQSSWYGSTDAVPALNVNASDGAGPNSGISSITCTNSANGANYTVGGASGTIPASDLANGTNTWSCYTTNGAGTRSGTATYTVHVDPDAGTVSFSGAQVGHWYSTAQTVTATASESPNYSGIASISCEQSGGAYTTTPGSSATVRVTANGQDTIECYTTTNAGVVSLPQSYVVDVDTTTPTISYAGAPDAPAWTAPPGYLTAFSNTGPSGTASLTCTVTGANQVNSGNPVTITSSNQSFLLQNSGTTTYSCSATSVAGLTSAAATYTVQTDATVPTVSITDTTNSNPSGWQAGGQTLKVTGAESPSASGMASTSCEVNNGAYQKVSGATQTLTVSTPGTDTITCYSTTNAGVQSVPATETLQIDNQSPTTSISGGQTAPAWNGGTLTLTAVGSEGTSASGISEISCSVDGGTAQTANASHENITVSGDGTHTVACSSVNGAGTQGQTTTQTYQIDGQSPTVSFSGATSGNWYNTPQTLTVTASEATDLSGVQSIECSVSGGSWTTYPGASAQVTISQTGTVTCQALTGAGDMGHAATFVANINSNAPVVYMSGAQAKPAWLSGPQVITVTGAESQSVAISSTTCSVTDGSGNTVQQATTAQGTSQTVNLSGTGNYTVSCYATDAAGNNSTTDNQIFQIDNTVPAVAFSGPAQNAWEQGTQTVSVTGSETPDLSDIASVSCNVDGGTYTTTNKPTASVSVSAPGSNTVDCYSTTNAGVKSDPESYIVNIDNQSPTVSWSASANADTWVTGPQTIVATFDEGQAQSGIASVTCSVNGGTPTVVSGASQTVTTDLEGPNNVSCYGTTNSGLKSGSYSYTVDIDNESPTVAYSGAVSAPAWAPGTQVVNVDASEAPQQLSGVASVTCSLDGGTSTTSQPPFTVKVSGDGTHKLSCSATTNAGLTGATSTQTIQIDSQAPTVAFSGAQPAPAWLSGDQTVNVTATGSGQSGIAEIDCTLDGAPSTAPGNTTNIAIKGNGTHTLTCAATSNAGVQGPSASETIQIDSATPTTSLSGAPAAPAWNATAQTVTATGQGGDSGIASVTCTVNGGAAHTTTGPVAEVPLTADGTYNISCYSTSVSGQQSAPANGTYQIDTETPSVALSGSTQAPAWHTSQQFVTVTATGNGPSPIRSITCTINGGAAQTSQGASTQLTLNQDGIFKVSCSATAANGLSSQAATGTYQIDSQTPTVSLSGAPQAPAWNATAQTITATGHTAGPSDIASVTCTVNGGQAQTTTGSTAQVSLTADGTYAVSCYTTSVAGTQSAPVTGTYQIDTETPTVAFSGVNPAPAWHTTAQTLTVTAAASGPSPIRSITCTVNNGAPQTTTGSSTQIQLTTGGDITVSCYSTAANGLNSTTVTDTYQMDLDTPTVALSGAPQAPAWNTTAQTITATGSTTGSSGISSVTCSVDGAPAKTTQGDTATMTLNSTGTHTVSCYSTAGDGAISQAANGTYQLDLTTPTLTFGGATPAPAWHTGSLSVTATGADDADASGVASVSCQVAGGDWKTVTGDEQQITINTAGATQIACYTTNNAGTQSATATETVQTTLANAGITFSGATPAPAWDNGTQTVTATATTDANGSVGSVTCTVDGGTAQTTQGPTATVTLTADGVHTISCYPTSQTGITGSPVTETVQIDSQQPTVTISGPVTLPAWNAGPQNVTAAAAETNALSGIQQTSCTVNGGAAQTFSGATGTFTIDSAGDYTISCQATTNAGVTGPAATEQIQIENPPSGALIHTGPSVIEFNIPNNGSGIKTVMIEVGSPGNWTALPTTYDPSTGIATAEVPDNWQSIDYDAEAVIVDNAGNKGVAQDGTGTANGSYSITAKMGVPIIDTKVTVLKKGTKARPAAGQTCTVKTVTRTTVAHGKRHKTRVRERICGGTSVALSKNHGTVKVAYGKKAAITGFLTDNGQPVAGAKVAIIAQQAGRTAVKTLGTATTQANGSFTYVIAPGADRTITATYAPAGAGTVRISGTVLVTGKLTVTAPKHATPGQRTRLTVTVAGAVKGQAVQLYDRPSPHGGWHKLGKALKSSGRATLRTTVKLPSAARLYLRASAAANPKWPYQAASSPTITLSK